MSDAATLSPRATRLLRLLVAWLLIISLFAWLPLLRSLFDGDTYEWASGPWFGHVFRGAGLHGDLWYLALKLALFAPAVVGLLRRWWPLGALLAATLAALYLTADLHTLLTLDEPLVFHGDTLGVRVNITALAPVASGLAFLVALTLVRDVARAPGAGPLPLAPANVRMLVMLGALLPIQFVLLQFGEPHGTTDAIGVVMTIAQWLGLAAALRIVTPRSSATTNAHRGVVSVALLLVADLMTTPRHASAQDVPRWMKDVRVETLENGLTVLLAPDASVPHVSVELWLPTGLREDPPGRRGLSHLFEHVLANTRVEIDTAGLRAARPRFADSNAQVRRDYARYFLLLDPSALDAGLALHAAKLRLDPERITDSLLAYHRQVVLNEQRNAVTATPSPTSALQRVYAADHPYALPPETEASVAAVDTAMLREYLRTRTAPQAAVLVLVGRFDAGWAMDRARAHFGPLEPGTPPSALTVETTPGPAHLETHVQPAARAAQYHRRFALPPLGDRVTETAELALHWASVLAAQDLGHELTWRLERTPGSLASDLTLSTSVPATLNAHRVAGAVEASLRRLASGDANATALPEARASARLAIWKGLDRLGFYDSRAEQLAEGFVLAGDAGWLAHRLAHIDSVAPQTLSTVASAWLERRGVEVVVPAGAAPRAVAGVSPAPIVDGTSTDYVREPATDTVLNGLRVVVAPLRHVPIVRVTLVGPADTVSVDLARDEVRDWLATLSSQPTPRRATTVLVVGDVDPPFLVAALARATAAWPAGTAPNAAATEAFRPGDSTIAVSGRAQARIVAEWSVDVGDARRDVMAQLVARRLWEAWNLELRTKRGWSYGASYAVEVQGDRAVLRVAAEVQPDRVAEAVKLVRGEIDRLADGSLAFPALDALRESLVQAALLEASTVSGLDRALRADVAVGRSARFREDRLTVARLLDAATVEAARRLVAPKGLRLTVIAHPAALSALQFKE